MRHKFLSVKTVLYQKAEETVDKSIMSLEQSLNDESDTPSHHVQVRCIIIYKMTPWSLCIGEKCFGAESDSPSHHVQVRCIIIYKMTPWSLCIGEKCFGVESDTPSHHVQVRYVIVKSLTPLITFTSVLKSRMTPLVTLYK